MTREKRLEQRGTKSVYNLKKKELFWIINFFDGFWDLTLLDLSFFEGSYFGCFFFSEGQLISDAECQLLQEGSELHDPIQFGQATYRIDAANLIDEFMMVLVWLKTSNLWHMNLR